MSERISSDFLEKLIIKGITSDKSYLVLVANSFLPDFFDSSAASKVFDLTQKHLDEHNRIPPKEVIFHTLNDNDVKELFEDIDSIEFDIKENYDYLIEETNRYLKDQAIKKAMMDSLEIIKKKDNPELIRQTMEDALCKDLKVDLGLAYFQELGDRLKKIFNTTDTRVPTYFPMLDDLITGGFPPLTLSVIVAKIHGFKSNMMANIAARQVLRGHIPVILTLEMSENMFAQRLDAIYSQMDINRMYFGTDNQKKLARKLKEVKNSPSRKYDVYIKQYPTGTASVRDFRVFLRELKMRDINPSIVYVDYINLMRSAYKKSDGDLYISVKSIAEELRALSFEFALPVVSVSQLNREGSFTGFEDVSFNYISESLGVPATADFMSIIGTSEDNWIYEHELLNKIVKSRFGGLNQIFKMYYDERTLKMYDESELEIWEQDAALFGTTRPLHEGR